MFLSCVLIRGSQQMLLFICKISICVFEFIQIALEGGERHPVASEQTAHSVCVSSILIHPCFLHLLLLLTPCLPSTHDKDMGCEVNVRGGWMNAQFEMLAVTLSIHLEPFGIMTSGQSVTEQIQTMIKLVIVSLCWIKSQCQLILRMWFIFKLIKKKIFTS